MIKSVFYIAFGAAFGGVLRYFISLGLNKNFGWGTLLVNIIGSFLLGFILVKSESSSISVPVKLMLTTGCMGALTTFSTFSYETVTHLQKGDFKAAIANILLNLILGFSAIYLAMKLAEKC